MSDSFHTDISGIGRNIARGILPTVDGHWDTPPPNLAHITDGDMNSPSGTGTTNLVAAGNVGSVMVDLGRIATVLFMAKVGIWTDANTTKIYLESYNDAASAWTYGLPSSEITAAAENIEAMFPVMAHTSRIKLRVYVTGAATVNVKIYEIIALEILP